MARNMKYTTFAPGELEARLREMTPKGTPIPSRSQFTNAGAGGSGTLLKAHCCAVAYPDGQSGDCRYERLGPRWHLFHYSYDESALPRQVWMQALGNDPTSIEAKAKELADKAYREAIAHERQHVFQRASEPTDGSRKKNPRLYRMKAGRAKELAGKYALCQPSGTAMVVVSPVYDTLDEANAAWQERNSTRLVVACCNRLDRAWQLPRFNPLYGVFDPRPRPKTPERGTNAGEASPPVQKERVAEQASTDAAETVNVGLPAPEPLGLGSQAPPPADALGEPLGADVSASPAQSGPCGFDRWMAEVAQDLEALYGLDMDDLPDGPYCPYQGWYEAGLTPEEAAGEAQEWAE